MRWTWDANEVTTTSPSTFSIASRIARPTLRSVGTCPGTSAFVESASSRSTFSSPSRAKWARSVASPSTGVWSILKSPECTIMPWGVRNANAQPSGIEWLTWTTSTSKGSCSITSPGVTSMSSGSSRSSHSSRIASTKASVSCVP